MLQFFQRLENHDSRFSIYDSFYRIKKLEKICLKENIDGLLIINGIDSKENYEYVKLMNWIFLGLSGVEIDTNEYLDSVLGETIFVVTKDHLRVYTDQQGFKKLKPLLLYYPNIKLFVPTLKEDENKDESEVLKMVEFVKMTQDLKRIGVLLPIEKNNNIEKWPIIQSYGLLGNGFFSMQFEIINLTERINLLYKSHDKHSLKTIINVIAKRLQGHVTGSLALLSEIPIKKRQTVTSDQMVEIFLDTYEIEDNKYIKRIKKIVPQVKFGNSCAPQPLHLTIESSDLYSSLRFARTYFLTKQIAKENIINPIFDEDEGFVKEYKFNIQTNSYYQDECLLFDIYKILTESLYEALQIICQDYKQLTNQVLYDISATKLNQIFNNYQIKFINEDLLVSVSSYNAYGEEVPINFKDTISFKLTPHFFNIRLEYQNIHSLINNEKLLGSIIFSESFILQENCFYIITNQIPYLQIINTDIRYSDHIEQIKKKLPLEQLGQQISEKVEKNRIFIPSKHSILEVPIFMASYYLHENGLRIFTNELGWIVILFEQMKKIRFVQGLESSWIMFITEPIVFSSLQCKIIALEFIGKSVEQVYLKINEIFKEKNIKFDYVENPKEFLITRQGQLISKKEIKQQLQGNQIKDSQFLLNYLEAKQLILLSSAKSDLKLLNFLELQIQKPIQEDRIGLILITGGFSTGKNKFAQSLSKYAVDFNQKSQIMQFNLLEQSIIDEEGWVNKLQTQLNYCKDQCICVIPFFLSIELIIQLIEKKLNQLVYIKNVVNKININNIYQNENYQIISNMVSLCLPGFCQFTILDSFGNEEQEVEEYHKIFRTICSQSKIFRVTNNMIQSSVAQEIYQCSSYNSAQELFLRNKFNSFRGKSNQYQRFFIHNTIPCIKQIRKNLREQFRNQSKLNQLQNQDKLSDIDKFLLKVKESCENPLILYFKGNIRIENQLDKLFEYTANTNYIVERQIKNINILMKEKTINEKKIIRPQYSGWDYQSNLGFFIVGINITKDLCQKMINSIIQQQPNLKPFLKIQDLDKDIIKEIEFQNRIIGLEDGQFYDGQFIRNQDGEILPHHPKLNQFLQEYIDQQNKKIQDENDSIVNEWNEYILSLQL